MKSNILILVAVLCSFCLSAQTYNTAGGLRFGTLWGITVKQRIAKKITLEGILQNSYRTNETFVTLLGEFHAPVLSKRFNVYTGVGLHKGWLEDPEFKNPFGISVIGGGEFTIARFNISYDIKPAINLVGGDKQINFHTGVSIRYVIDKKEWKPFQNKKKKRRKKDKKWWEVWK